MKRVATQYPGIYYRERAKGRVYEIAYTDSLGKRVFKTVEGNLKDAQLARADVLRRQGQGEKIVSTRMTVKELAEIYLREQTGHLRESTKKTYGDTIDDWIVPRLGRLKVSEVDVNVVAGFVADMRKDHAAWTVRGSLTPLSRMFAFAVRRGWSASNPVRLLEKQEKPTGVNKPMRILDSSEIQLLLKKSTDHFRPLLMTAIFSGLRIGELLRLRWEDIDWHGQVIRVRGVTKTEAGVRDVVIPKFLVEELARLSLDLREDGGLVFTTKDGRPLERRAATRGALERPLAKAKLPACRFHDLRHTFASILIGQGEDVTYVADQLGHSSPLVTLRVYAKLFDPKARRDAARERMQEAFAGVVS